MCTVFNRESAFLKPDQVYITRTIPVSSTGDISISLPNLPAGTYAISSFHDLDGNGQLTTNYMGIPSEPYGFSNGARPSYRAPLWQEACFYWNGQSGNITIRLEKMVNRRNTLTVDTYFCLCTIVLSTILTRI